MRIQGARLFFVPPESFREAPQDGSLSVTIVSVTKLFFFNSPRIILSAAFVFRRNWTRLSSASPSSSTARHGYIRLPAMDTNTSSRCNRASGGGRAVLKSPGMPQLQCPASRRLIRNIDATCSEQNFDVSVAEGKPEIQPDSVLNDLGWKYVSGTGKILHPATLLRQQQQVTLAV